MLTRTAGLILTLQNNVDPNSQLDPDRTGLMFTRTAGLILIADV
jgi:hypothetical protein